MTYETAKKLKDAGFYQGEEEMSAQTMWHPDYLDKGSIPKDLVVYVPTLSELIEACGHYFYQLTKEDDGSWTCASINGYPKSGFGVTNFTTPEEAVAELWLALNKTI